MITINNHTIADLGWYINLDKREDRNKEIDEKSRFYTEIN